MRRFWCIILLTVLFSTSCLAQSYRENRRLSEKIAADTLYYYGDSGECASAESAFDKGIENILKNISTNYKSNALCDIGFEPYRKFIEQNVSSLIITDEKEFQLFFYLKRSELRDEINFRYENIISYINHGIDALNDSRVGDALRFYYWAQMLCHVHPNGARLIYDDGESKTLIKKWLNDRIEEIASSVRMLPVAMDTVDGDLHVTLTASTTEGQTISNLRYYYNNGQNYRPNTFENSKSLLILKNLGAEMVSVKIDMMYYTEAEHLDPDVYLAMNSMKEPLTFSGSTKKINLKGFKEKQKTKPQTAAVKEEVKNVETVKNEYLDIIEDVENAIRANNIEAVRECFSEDGYAMLYALSKYGRFAVIGNPDYRFIDYGDEVLCRSIPMQFDFKNNVSFCREVVFRFDKSSKKITSLAFKLSDVAENDILSKSRWGNDSKMVLINFLEDYQTAYALKRLDYLEQIFSDDAIIIVGRVLKQQALQDKIECRNPDAIRYSKRSKEEYLKGLEAAFRSREYINLRFTDTDFTRAVGEANDVYGIQVRQEFFSSSYGDIGYLFLLVDLRNELPIIHVRTWQPDETNTDDLVRINWFKM